jgi:hypothetical protein
MTRQIDPIPDRIRGAGLVMIILGLPVAAMPIGLFLGAHLERGIGFTILGGPVAVLPSMLPWLAPLAAGTFVVGLFLYFGRLVREGLVVALAWMLGVAAFAPTVAMLSAIVAYSIWTGQRRMTARSSGLSSAATRGPLVPPGH